MNNIQYLKTNRKQLRNNSTAPEAVLWKYLQKRKLGGYKFRRQHSIGNYIIDFYCPEKKIAIELDGEHHFSEDGHQKDNERTSFLINLGIKVLRFENRLVYENQSQLLEFILNELERDVEK